MVKAPKFCHVTPILISLHWLKINERVEYKLLSLTYKALTTAQPIYLHSLNHQSLISLCITSSLESTFCLILSFRQPCTKHPADDVTLSNSPPTCSPLSPSSTHTHSLFHSRLKTHLFHKSFPPYLLAPTRTAFSDYTGPNLLCSTVFHF